MRHTTAVALDVLLAALYARFRARGEDAGTARESAAGLAAELLGCPLPVARAAAAALDVSGPARRI